jgi:hypothetical protein
MVEGSATGQITGAIKRVQLRDTHGGLLSTTSNILKNFDDISDELIKTTRLIEISLNDESLLNSIRHRNAKTRTIPRIINIIERNFSLFSRLNQSFSPIDQLMGYFSRMSLGRVVSSTETKQLIPEVSGEIAQFTKFTRELRTKLQLIISELDQVISESSTKFRLKELKAQCEKAVIECDEVAESIRDYSKNIRQVIIALDK